jgi:hypothetical protein
MVEEPTWAFMLSARTREHNADRQERFARCECSTRNVTTFFLSFCTALSTSCYGYHMP